MHFLIPLIKSLRLQGESGSATLTLRILCNRMSDMYTTPETHSKVFVLTRNRHIVPKERRVERLPAGYSIQECQNDSRGHYWFVITALEMLCRPVRI